MAITRQIISTGTSANDGTGDTLRTAGTKINANFAEVYAFLGGGDSSNLSSLISLDMFQTKEYSIILFLKYMQDYKKVH